MEEIIGSCDICNLTRQIDIECENCESVTCKECMQRLLAGFDYKIKINKLEYCYICKDFKSFKL